MDDALRKGNLDLTESTLSFTTHGIMKNIASIQKVVDVLMTYLVLRRILQISD